MYPTHTLNTHHTTLQSSLHYGNLGPTKNTVSTFDAL